MAHRKSNGRRGSALLEFGLCSTLLLLLLGGTAEIGRSFHYANLVASAARAGTQFGMTSAANANDLAGMEKAALAEPGNPLVGLSAKASNYCQCPGSKETIACGQACPAGKAARQYIEVETSYTMNTMVNWMLAPHSFPLNGRSVMRVK